MNRHLLAIVLPTLLAACASTPHDYTAYLQHMPKSILVLPPVNDTIEVNAGAQFLSTVTAAIAERGYYVPPIAVVEAMLRQNGAPMAADMHAVERSKLLEVFGADAVLYVHLKEWGTSYQVVATTSQVVIQCTLVDLRTGTVLWTGTGAGRQQSGGGDLVGMLANAVVSTVATSIVDPCPELARTTNWKLFGANHDGLLVGWRHPDFEQDQARRRAAAAPAAKD